MGPSAALTPAIWDKTIPYDGETFHLEYMDLEEFLMENGIPTSPDEDAEEGNVVEKAKVTASSRSKVAKPAKGSPVTLMPIQELDKCDDEVVIINKTDADATCDVITGELLTGGCLTGKITFTSRINGVSYLVPQNRKYIRMLSEIEALKC